MNKKYEFMHMHSDGKSEEMVTAKENLGTELPYNTSHHIHSFQNTFFFTIHL